MISRLEAAEAAQSVENGIVLVDIRPFTDFDASHISGSISVEYSRRSYAPRLDMVLPASVPVILVSDDDEQIEGIATQLTEAGREVMGAIAPAVWIAVGLPTGHLKEIDIDTMVALFDSGAPLLDIREEIEWEFLGVIFGATRIPLEHLGASIDEVRKLMSPEHPLILLCSAGLRSSTAASILFRAGIPLERMCHPPDGLNGWLRAGLPLMRLEVPSSSEHNA